MKKFKLFSLAAFFSATLGIFMVACQKEETKPLTELASINELNKLSESMEIDKDFNTFVESFYKIYGKGIDLFANENISEETKKNYLDKLNEIQIKRNSANLDDINYYLSNFSNLKDTMELKNNLLNLVKSSKSLTLKFKNLDTKAFKYVFDKAFREKYNALFKNNLSASTRGYEDCVRDCDGTYQESKYQAQLNAVLNAVITIKDFTELGALTGTFFGPGGLLAGAEWGFFTGGIFAIGNEGYKLYLAMGSITKVNIECRKACKEKFKGEQ
jgi:hypothetical protein